MTIVYKEFPTDITSKANPVDADILLIADSEDNNEMKKITIGSITADIGDGLITDASASLTTTYSSTKINADNATQDAALTAGLALKVSKAWDNMTGLLREAQSTNIASATTTDLSTATGNSVTITGTTTITGLGTVQAGTTIKATFSGILTLTHNATSLILPNASTNITTAVGDTAIFVSLGSGNWKCINYTRVDWTSLASVSVVGLTEDTTGDMDNDFVLAYDASATANRKQKINVYRATSGDITTGTTTTKFPSVAQIIPLFAHASGTTTKNAADASTTQNIAHGLWRVPKYVKITAMFPSVIGGGGSLFSYTTYNGTTQSSYSIIATASGSWYLSIVNTFTIDAEYTAGTNTQTGVITFDATNIIITWTKTGSPIGQYYLVWEAQ